MAHGIPWYRVARLSVSECMVVLLHDVGGQLLRRRLSGEKRGLCRGGDSGRAGARRDNLCHTVGRHCGPSGAR